MSIIITFLVLQGDLFEPQNILKFSDYLYAEQNYGAALNEYRRYIFLTDSVRADITERIIDCLVKLQRFDEAIKESAKIDEEKKCNYTRGVIYFRASEFDSSRSYLTRVDIPYKKDAQTMIGLGYAWEFNFTDAGKYISLPKDPPIYKSPAWGAVFSLVPGGGHFYCGRIGDGFFSFFVVGLSSLLAYHYYHQEEDVKFAFALGSTILFYAGNIYGGINAVHNYNYYENEKYLRKIEAETNKTELEK